MRIIWLLLLIPVAMVARAFWFGRRNVMTLPEDHPEMANAIRGARETLAEFRRLVASPEQGMKHFGVKVRFGVEGGCEHCWVNELEVRDSGFVGKLGNQPNGNIGLQLGSTVNVEDSAITDWSYSRDGVYQGHFTTKVLLAHMPTRMRREVETVYGWRKAA
ncbi:MAG TPA: DUF2314 domain-containing protein [Gemmatimonadaceae bacterium]|nr:DUF2314 domain-containing protein [Gemmatimonadaceae bacterium]